LSWAWHSRCEVNLGYASLFIYHPNIGKPTALASLLAHADEVFAAVHETVVGTKPTTSDVRSVVANGWKADVARTAHFGSQ